MIKSPTNKKARIKMGDLWSRAGPIRSKKARMKMGDLWSRVGPIRR